MSIGFITWGTKTKLRKVGYVADFCPICRRVTPFLLLKITSVKHIQDISFGQGETVGYTARCRCCPLPILTDIGRYQSTNPQLPPDLDTLIVNTFPAVNEHHRDRLALEREIKIDPTGLPPQTRSVLIDEPFSLLSPHRPAQRLVDESDFAWFWPIVTIAIACMAISQGSKAIGISLTAVVCLIYFTVRSNSRQRVIRAMLANALAPLKPTPEEVLTAATRWKMTNPETQKLIKSIERPMIDSVYLV
jgi:hypothetical protein